MNPALSTPPAHTLPRLVTHRPRSSYWPEQSLLGREHRAREPLARYADRQGNPREVIVRQGLAGSVLVVDRDAVSLGDCLLVAHLAADEPAENAVLVCRSYLEDVRSRRLRCRGVTEQDVHASPMIEETDPSAPVGPPIAVGEQVDSRGCVYGLDLVPAGMSIPALRWCRRKQHRPLDEHQPVSLREAIASLEHYEPTCTLTQRALAAHRDDCQVSTSVLAAELIRVRESPIVLNRRLREVVLAALESERLSMSEIAIRCGRLKRDSRGNESGETSWLARRLGLLPESGQRVPTPWIHTDVLALIARRGLGISPREVELQ